jgi:hypothetical protein
MTMAATANKSWFLHLNGQPQGPFTLDQVAAKYRDGTISRDSHVWCEGMPAWLTVKDVPEVSAAVAGLPETPSSPSIPAPTAPPTAQELSHLIALNPGEVDDRTNAIDPKQLRDAKKAAAKAHKVADKAERQAIAIGNSVVGVSSGGGAKRAVLLLLVGLPALAAAGLGGAVALKLVTVDQLKARAGSLLGGLLSTLPSLDDVAPAQYEALRDAAGADLQTAGPQAAAALSTQSPDKPIFYVASNLPEGARVSFLLKSDPANSLAETPVEIRFPLTLSKHLARSRPLHVLGKPLPQGEYVVTLSPDDEQPAEARAWLAKSRLAATQRFFVGGARDAAFTAKLNQFHEKQREKALVEYRQGLLLATRFEGQLALCADAAQALEKATRKPAQKKAWDEFERKWAPGNVEPLEKGALLPDVFTAVHELWAESRRTHDLLAASSWAQAGAQLAQSQQKVNALKARLDAISRQIGAAPVAGH